MSFQHSSSDSSSFELLDSAIQRWIWQEGWSTLRDIQEQSIPAIIDANQDVIISANTSAGKTEACFFPCLTNLLNQPEKMGFILCISPLKALINDQWKRLDLMCESLGIPVVGWHGDVAASKKASFLKKGDGVVIITPESLEALFVNKGTIAKRLFAGIRYTVVDELHSFIGSERGKQLQSLMHRVEMAAGKFVPRIGLSATLGDMDLAAQYLRGNESQHHVKVLVSKNGNQSIKILIKGYVNTPPANESEKEENRSAIDIANHLFDVLRNSNNLVYPNSRSQVEFYSDYLRRRCEDMGLLNVFWPHHGNLSKEIREETEQALKDPNRPATGICTSTMELGIDVGDVVSVAQIGCPPSVSSLKQRVGRSGRREGQSPTLRGYCIEHQVTPKSNFNDCIHEELLHFAAMVKLMLAGWFEPPVTNGVHASTLVQQLLSIIAERGGVNAATAWGVLIASGPFKTFTKDDFTSLLRHMGEKKLIMQETGTGLLLLGELGEKLVNHYEFYCSFESEEEYRVECNGKVLGALPIDRPLSINEGIMFAGRRWRVIHIDPQAKRIQVIADKGGSNSSFFGEGGLVIHDKIRATVKELLESNEDVKFLDSTAQNILSEARSYFQSLKFDSDFLLPVGREVILCSWLGDRINRTIALYFKIHGIEAEAVGVSINIKSNVNDVKKTIAEIVRFGHYPIAVLLQPFKDLNCGKWSWAIPREINEKSFSSLYLDQAGALAFLGTPCFKNIEE